MKKILTLLNLLPAVLFGQTFSYGSLTAIPNNQTDLYIPIVVTGLPAVMDTTFGITSVCVDITHQHMADLKLRLQSPVGTEILLSDQRGGSGSGYHSICFQENGSNGWVTSIAAPYTGSYIPQNSLNTFNVGENPNGTWNLIITDVFNFLDTGFAHSVDITFASNPPASAPSLFICTTSNAGGCYCPDSTQQNCDLLPDMTASWGSNWSNPYSESPGYLYVSTLTPNIGWGPLEIHGTNNCYCDTVSVPCTTSTCPNGDPPKQLVNQRIYHKNAGTMTFWDRPAGSMAYHPSHGHIHVDEWVWIDVRRRSGDPDPRNWPKTGLGAKQSYCLVNLGDCTSNYGACRDNNGNILTQADIPNSSMGSVSGCGANQGIYVGEYDTYGSILVSMPPTTCNGDYYIVSITDPLDAMLEHDDNNNWLVIPATLTQQLGAGTFEPEGFLFQTSGAQVNCLSNSFASDSMMWDWGDGFTTMYYSSPVSSHVYSAPGTYIIGEYAYNHCGLTYSADTIEIFLTTNLNAPAKAIVSWNVYPNPAKDKINIDYTLANASDVKIEVTDAVGRTIKDMNNADQYAGKYHVSLNLNTEEIKQGIYFVRLTSINQVLNQRFIVLK